MARSFWSWMTRFWPTTSSRRAKRRPQAKGRKPHLELLEARDVPSGLQPDYVILPQSGGATPYSSSGPSGTTPSQIRNAYGFNQISFTNGTVAADGSGTTIAIVDAYDDPTIASDLQQFDLQFGLPNPVFTKVNQNGGSTLPAADSGWSDEISLDVEWAHAIAPGAHILLVEANDNSYTNLFAAAAYAAKQPNVVAVSMSFGGSEFSGEKTYDSTFTTPSGHAGVTFLASSGDNGAPASYPATSPNVVAVGGTTLNLTSSGTILSESGWSGSGGGISTIETQPAYQKGVVTQSTNRRTNPDVAYDADPNTGFPVYNSYSNPSYAPWAQFGGTSDAAPQWAALVAVADQGRALAGLGSLNGATQTLPALYSLSAGDFHDITSGSSTGSPGYSAKAGYDLVTGRGTPVANKVIADLVGQSGTPVGVPSFSVTAQASSTAGSAFTVTVTALSASGSKATGYTGTVHFTSSDTAAGLPADYIFSSSNLGVQSFSVTLKTAGSQTITVTDKANGSDTGSDTVAVNPASASKLAFGQQPTSAAVGVAITPAVTVQLLDAYGNLVTSDNTDQVKLSLGSNPGSATLGGTTTMTVSGGVATFSNLSVSQIASGYTLKAASATLTGATSASFNVITASAVIENFETTETWNVVNGPATAYRATWAAHDGNYGLDMYNGNDWIYRNGTADHVAAGDTLSVWLAFYGSADGRAYFGFGAGAGGTLSLVAAPNSGELILQENLGYGFTDLASVPQFFVANQWYRLEVDWGTSGTVIGKLFAGDGTTLLNTVTASTAGSGITSGGVAFRATGSDKYWDTVTVTHGVNNFAVPATGASGSGGSSAKSGDKHGGGEFGASLETGQAYQPSAPTSGATVSGQTTASAPFVWNPATTWSSYWSASTTTSAQPGTTYEWVQQIWTLEGLA